MNSIKSAWGLYLFFACLSSSSLASAEIAIIASLNSGVDSITQEQAKKLWLGKSKKLPGIGRVKILEHKKDSPIKKEFHQKITKKNQTQLNAYWAKVIFTGRAVPPKKLSTDDEIIEIVSKKTNFIGYVDNKSVNDRVKVLMTIK